LYKRLKPLADSHLDKRLCLADGSIPAEDTTLAERFPQYDPLNC
jgi:phenylacetic acid degradation operon negative regulatory protein